MAKIGEKKAKTGSEEPKMSKAEIEAKLAGVDLNELYNQAESERVVKSKRGTANAEQIRAVRDKLFEIHTELAIAGIEDTVNKAYGLEKNEETGVDNRVQNSSVRSACTAEGKFEITNVKGQAILRKKTA